MSASKHQTSTLGQQQKAVDENYEAFVRILPDLIRSYPGKFVVMRHKRTTDFFDTFSDAYIHGMRTYSDGLFSIQEVTNSAAEIGAFSHADLSDPVQ